MGMSSGKSGGVSGVNSEINVTPMADIMLVLLIIFMITTPMMQKGITVDLPKGSNVIDMPEADKRDALTVGCDRQTRLYFDNKPYDEAQLKEKLTAAKEMKGEDRIFFKCDQSVVYEKVVGTLEILRDAGFEQIGLLVDRKK